MARPRLGRRRPDRQWRQPRLVADDQALSHGILAALDVDVGAADRRRADAHQCVERPHIRHRTGVEDDPAGRPSYAALAAELEIQTTDVTNYLAFARREIRRLVLEKLREITATEEEFRAEAAAVLGVAP